MDLRGLVDPDLTIIDYTGREWKIAADLPLRAALGVVQLQQTAQSGEFDAATFGAVVDGVWSILRRSQPQCTREDVLDAFSVTEMMQLLEYINFRMRTRRGAPAANGAAPTSAQTEPEEESTPVASTPVSPRAAEATPKLRPSRRKSAQDS